MIVESRASETWIDKNPSSSRDEFALRSRRSNLLQRMLCKAACGLNSS